MRKSLIAILALILVSCGSVSPEDREKYLPESNGKHGDILLLIEDNLYNSDIGQLIDSNINIHPEGVYLRPEPMFSYFHKRPSELNHMNQLNRNILKVTIEADSNFKETQFRILPNYFAKHQLFILIKDNDEDRLYDFLSNNWDKVANEFNDHELNEYMRYYRSDPNDVVREMAEKNFGIDIILPSESKLRSDKKEFAWVMRERSHRLTGNDATNAQGGVFWIQQGILFWTEKYDSAAQMNIENLLQKRDTVLKYNVEGKVPGSYMATEYDPYYAPKGRKFNHKGSKAVEIRGLWKHAGHRGAFGGGPFVQYTILNEKTNEMVTVCGYIYGPKFDKREYIREVDAMLQSIEVL
mgnify:CR=1 FL=1